ncbi:esterase FE4-like [Ctenocephalides felis]|uniref:esterase FE4-like n=1 Tax=Ctenocephalides felis TaxID=7515 RepID=UPI000E6E23C1|nr:esterase FE4-like [Ctenocephalides felis]
MILNYFILVICALIFAPANAGPRVRVEQGQLEGKSKTTATGKKYNCFLGIPYAKPPVGNLRFKSITDLNYFISENRFLYVYLIQTFIVLGSEDCLYLNVYTPKITKSQSNKLPVVFVVHGGGFYSGSGNDKDTMRPDWLVEKDIVVVTFNYRLGPFGFLCLDIPEAPGNAGLKDQVAALRWVKQNIAKFGGDPDNITLIGMSAGAASVNYLQITDTTKGLFQRSYQISGSALAPWAYVEDPKKNAFKLCSILGQNTQSSDRALEYLLMASAQDLLLALGRPPYSSVADFNMQMRDIVFLPVSEKNFTGQEAFLTESPQERLESGRFQNLPLLISITDGEGLVGLLDAVAQPRVYGLIDINFERYVPKDYNLPTSSELSLQAAQEIKDYYYANTTDSQKNFQKYVDIKGDTWIKKGVQDQVKLMAKNNADAIYYHLFTLDEFSDFKIKNNFTFLDQSAHANNNEYIFYQPNFPKSNPIAEKTRQRMLKILQNFIETGNPTSEMSDLLPVDWPPVTKTTLNYLHIDKELSLEVDPGEVCMKFWDDLKMKYKNLVRPVIYG